MKLKYKITIFFGTISILLLLFSFNILQNTKIHLDKFEEKIIEKNILSLFDSLYIKYELLKNIAFEYSTKEEIIDSLGKDTNIDLKKYFFNQKISHLIIYDKNKKLISAIAYDLNSDEFIDINTPLEKFDFEKYVNDSKINFLTLDYEKLIFAVDNIKKGNEVIGYIIVARTLDSHFLLNLTKVTGNYLSLLSTHKLENYYEIDSYNQKMIYDIYKEDDKTLFTQVKLTDVLSNQPFFISLKIDRDFFVQMNNDNKNLFTIFVFTLIFLLISLYFFITIIFTRRIEKLTNNIKTINNSHSLRLKINMEFNDEITYLAKKINDMLIAIDTTQHEEIKRERDFLQSVLDTQQNIILITDGNEIHSTNKKFVDNFQTKDLFLSNIALLDNTTHSNLLKIAKKFGTEENPAKLRVYDNKDRYFTFDVQKLDIEKYLICMNDVSTYKEKISHYKQKATIDELTSVYNKAFITELTKEWLKYKYFAFGILDIDFFKKINDTYGHFIGDCILRDLASILKINLPKNDFIGRFGGEEFVILIDNDNITNTKNIFERLRFCIEQFNFKYGELCIKVTISLGFTFNNTNEKFEEIYKRADKALYKSKENGRNQINLL